MNDDCYFNFEIIRRVLFFLEMGGEFDLVKDDTLRGCGFSFMINGR
jgi:hypothetical protein